MPFSSVQTVGNSYSAEGKTLNDGGYGGYPCENCYYSYPAAVDSGCHQVTIDEYCRYDRPNCTGQASVMVVRETGTVSFTLGNGIQQALCQYFSGNGICVFDICGNKIVTMKVVNGTQYMYSYFSTFDMRGHQLSSFYQYYFDDRIAGSFMTPTNGCARLWSYAKCKHNGCKRQ